MKLFTITTIKAGIVLPALLTLLLSTCVNSWAQTTIIKGYITDNKGNPIPELSIIIDTIRPGVSTNKEGYFEINDAAPGIHLLIITNGKQVLHTDTIVTEKGGTLTRDIRLINREHLSEVTVETVANSYITERPSASLRLDAPLLEIPQNISVISSQTIKDIGANTTDDLLRTAAGVLPVNNAGQDIYTMIRGATTSNSILRNGMGSGYYYNMNPDPAIIDRVEFIKGPSGFMASHVNPGGMINIMTRQPTHQKTMNAEIGYGSWNMLRAAVDLGGEVKKSKAFIYRLNAGVQNQDRPYNYGYFRKYFIAGSLQYEPGKHTDITLEYNFSKGKSLDDVRYLPSVDGRRDLVPEHLLISDPNASGIKSYDHYFKLSLQHKFSEHWRLNAHAGMVIGKWNANGFALDVGREGGAVSGDTIYRYGYRDDFNNRLYNAIAFLEGKYNTGKYLQHKLMLGLDMGKTSVSETYEEQTDRNNNLYFPNPVYGLPKDIVQGFAADAFYYQARNRYEAVYLQEQLKIFNKLIITIATRYTVSRTLGYPDTSVVQTDKKLTPRLGLTYLLNKNLSFYAVTDEGFLPQVGQNFAGEQFKPLTGNNKEIGLKSFWFDRKLSLNLSAYRIVRNNALTPDPAYPNFRKSTGQSITKGIELDVMGQVTRNISLLANYAYTDARITESSIPEEVGSYVLYAPLHSIANVFVKYRFTQQPLSGLSLSLGLQYKDKFSAAPSPGASLPGYTLLEAAAGYSFKKWYLNLNVYNLTNTDYISFGKMYSDTEYMYAPGLPLNFRLGIGFSL